MLVKLAGRVGRFGLCAATPSPLLVLLLGDRLLLLLAIGVGGSDVASGLGVSGWVNDINLLCI